MQIDEIQTKTAGLRVEPLCPVFGPCGGCAYQDRPYQEELHLKERALRELFRNELDVPGNLLDAICASPEDYHYRNRIDLTLKKFKDGTQQLGFQHAGTKRLIPVDACAIARQEISERIPEIFEQAKARLPENYRNANLVLRTGDDGRVFWGGIGRKSLEMNPRDYFWTEIRGVKIFYSLDTFFQANLSILPALVEKIETAAGLDTETLFLDLYAGVGLFGIALANQVKQVIAVEESATSVHLMRHNKAYHGLGHFDIREGKVERELPEILESNPTAKKVAVIDPPRRGLSPEVSEALCRSRSLDALLYLSCSPKSLIRDLRIFKGSGWRIERVMPFDFFPKTGHLETLVLLKP